MFTCQHRLCLSYTCVVPNTSLLFQNVYLYFSLCASAFVCLCMCVCEKETVNERESASECV